LRYAFALLFCPVAANAGVAYDLNVQAVDQSSMASASPGASAPAPIVLRCLVENGRVRVDAAGAKTVYLFEDRTVYVIDDASRSVRVLKHATLSDVTAHYADAVRQLQEAAANAAPEDRAEAERKAADLKAASDRLLQPVARKYTMTARIESVDGHACRIWEERERDEKRSEFCVAPTAALPGGADILGGMQTLSEFRQGSKWALGVDFGLSDWWPDVAHLGGVPLLVREFKYDSLISEITLTSVRLGIQNASSWNLPADYPLQESNDYAAW
jgi:hypothetical protein